MDNRLDWVDIYKGIAIILVVFGHSNSPITGYIYLFHMAAFFFISGYTTNFNSRSTTSYIINKIQTLVIPFFVINLAFYLFRFVLTSLGIEGFLYKDTVSFSGIKNLFVYQLL